MGLVAAESSESKYTSTSLEMEVKHDERWADEDIFIPGNEDETSFNVDDKVWRGRNFTPENGKPEEAVGGNGAGSDDSNKPAGTCLSTKGIAVVIPVDSMPRIRTITHQFMLVTYAFSLAMRKTYPIAFIELDQTFHQSLAKSTELPSFRISTGCKISNTDD
ncbi:hypothetical protein Aperf_G00000066236 [Anoplocephala perfoliata]